MRNFFLAVASALKANQSLVCLGQWLPPCLASCASVIITTMHTSWHTHRCVLTARSLFFRKQLDPNHKPPPPPPQLGSWPSAAPELVIPVSSGSIRYEGLVLVLQFLYCGQASVAAPRAARSPATMRGRSPRLKKTHRRTIGRGIGRGHGSVFLRTMQDDWPIVRR